MSQIRKYKKKIRSVKNIAKITRAMQMVSASKMKRAEALAQKSKVYSSEIYFLAKEISTHIDKEVFPLTKDLGDVQDDLVLLIAPEKGLCGSLIGNIYKKIVELKRSGVFRANKFVVIGRKGGYIAKIIGAELIAEFSLGLAQPSYEIIPPVARLITQEFLEKKVGKVVMVYSEFINTLSYEIKFKDLLPIQEIVLSGGEETIDNNGLLGSSYTFEPDSFMIASEIFSMYLELTIYQGVLDSFASEQSARMVAMKNATDNAKELAKELTLTYNKERQMSVTNEILDINSATTLLTAN